ncbi:radical SAM protein [Clostridium sp. Marseille-P2415]|uniref:radical SAM protein n=1 Tax=Clostridium sp. Marseille-P2415 TaxID=1805471 RepID=UPI0009887680|nr:PqqD family peptide modification chaperone [Clostridium sp. Marseille-P2415]
MENKYLYINQNVELEYQPDHMILLKVKGVDNKFGNGKYMINQIGAEILQLIDGTRTYREIVEYLSVKYSEDSSSIEKKIDPFFSRMKDKYKLEILEGEKTSRIIEVKHNINNYPRVATIELTNACNLKCIHCYGSFGEENIIMPLDSVYKLLSELNEMGVVVIELTGGEITMHPNLNKIIKYALSLDFNRISMLTNGVSLQPDTLDLIIENKNRIYVQIDFQSFEDKYLEWFTKKKNTLEKITNNIKTLAANEVPMRIATMVTRKNLSELEKIADWIHELGIKKWGLGLVMALGRAKERDSDLLFADEENPKFVDIINKTDKKYPGLISYIDDARTNRTNCGAISSHIVISCDGRTKICAMDTGNYFTSGIGNALVTNLKTLYRDNKEFVHGFGQIKAPSYDSELCKECKNKYFCHGCLLRGMLSAKEIKEECRWYAEAVDKKIKFKLGV